MSLVIRSLLSPAAGPSSDASSLAVRPPTTPDTNLTPAALFDPDDRHDMRPSLAGPVISTLQSTIRVLTLTFDRLTSKAYRRCVRLTYRVCCPIATSVQIKKQVAQLSQRDRAAGWVSNGQKWKTGTERQYLRTV